jgi:hypothetical protein
MIFTNMRVSFRFKRHSMKKFLLLLLSFSAVLSCTKSVKVPVSYTVTTPGTDKVKDIDIPNTGVTNMPITVKFLSGYAFDKVRINLVGLPFDIVTKPDTFDQVPTYTGVFVLTTNNARPGVYPVSIVAKAPGSEAKTYPFNITVVRTDCSSEFYGTLVGSNACSARNYTYTATAQGTAVANQMVISNFGGYGAATSTYVVLDCKTNTLTIPQQNIGNNTNLSGHGTFTSTGMNIEYTASTTPLGFGETCTVTLNKQ